MSHAIVSMVDHLRVEGRYGFLFANGGFATDNHCIVLGSKPVAAASFPQDFDYQAEAEAKRGAVPALVEDYTGAATIETYTIFYGRDGAPRAGVVVARTPPTPAFVKGAYADVPRSFVQHFASPPRRR